jgi:hypothetical protein
MRIFLPLVIAATIAGCGSKKAPEAAAEPAKAQITASMPDSAEATALAEQLVEHGINDWSPTGSRDFKWTKASFHPDGSLKVAAKIIAGGETIECPETGTWSIAEAESKSGGIVEWNIVKTSCATRDNGTTQRVQLSYSGSETKISFR